MEKDQNQASTPEPQALENIVVIEDDRMFTTSLIVAEAFEKEHKDVLKAISNLECSKEFNERNFAPVEYRDAKGEMRPAYRITRDGFAFLAMGFTGKKAAAWKEKFLETFNAMERQIRKIEPKILMPPREAAATRRQRIIKLLQGHIAFWAFIDQLPYQVAELAVCTHAGIDRLENITEEGDGPKHIQDAFTYLETMSNHVTGDKEGDKISQSEIQLLERILEACGQWRFTRDRNFEKYFSELTGLDFNKLIKLSSHDARKMLVVAGCLLRQTYQYSTDWRDFVEM